MNKRNFILFVAGIIAMSSLVFAGQGLEDETLANSKLAVQSNSIQDGYEFVDPNTPADRHEWTEAEVLALYLEMRSSGYVEYPFTWENIQAILDRQINVPPEYLTAEIMTAVVVLKQPTDYFIDLDGLH